MMVTPPQPNGGFRWVQLGAVSALTCQALEPFAAHFFTTRAWRLGFRTPDAASGWLDVAAMIGVRREQLRTVYQVHGAEAVVYRNGEAVLIGGGPPTADIVITDDSGAAVAVQTADCLPMLVVDRRTRAVGAAHAGWRGLAIHVPQVAVARMISEFGCRREDLLVAIGPAIGACCYEVGEDVRARFVTEGCASTDLDRWFLTHAAMWAGNPPMRALSRERRPDHWFFDGWTCARDQLEAAGVARDQIFSAELCTASHDTFCSYRRDGAAAGRMAAVIRSKAS